MKIILACEGGSEVHLIKNLIKRSYLNFGDNLFMDEPICLRQLKEVKPLIAALPLEEEITVYRIGDTLKDVLSLTGFEARSKYIKSYKICTKTEIEILVIINENLYSDYLKVYRTKRPKEYIKEKIPNFSLTEYLESHDLFDAIGKYKKLKKHKKDELYLIDLIEKYKI